MNCKECKFEKCLIHYYETKNYKINLDNLAKESPRGGDLFQGMGLKRGCVFFPYPNKIESSCGEISATIKCSMNKLRGREARCSQMT